MIIGSGIATLVNGSVTVPLSKIPATARVFLTRQNRLGTVGDLAHSSINPGVSFDITSLNILDQSSVYWMVTV